MRSRRRNTIAAMDHTLGGQPQAAIRQSITIEAAHIRVGLLRAAVLQNITIAAVPILVAA